MSKSLSTRLDDLEKRSGGSIIGILDEAQPLGVDGVTPLVLISGSGESVPLPEFERRYPDAMLIKFVDVDMP